MLDILAEAPLSVKELTAKFGMSQPAVSQHLKELREAHLVSSERSGPEQRYRLTPQPLRYVIRWAEQYRTLIDPEGHAWAFAGSLATNSGKRTSKEKDRYGR